MEKTAEVNQDNNVTEMNTRLDDQSFFNPEVQVKELSHPAMDFIMKRMLTIV